MRLSAALAMVGTLALFAAILAPVFVPARGCTKCGSTLGRVKQIGLGMIVYADDHDDLFPPGDAWMDATYPYVRKWSLYHCPLLPQGRWGYAFNRALDRAKWHEEATTIPMVYDSTDLRKNASDVVTSLPKPGRHNGKNEIAYADGHVKMVVP